MGISVSLAGTEKLEDCYHVSILAQNPFFFNMLHIQAISLAPNIGLRNLDLCMVL